MTRISFISMENMEPATYHFDHYLFEDSFKFKEPHQDVCDRCKIPSTIVATHKYISFQMMSPSFKDALCRRCVIHECQSCDDETMPEEWHWYHSKVERHVKRTPSESDVALDVLKDTDVHSHIKHVLPLF